MSCCDKNPMCNQGRNCPNRKEFNLDDIKWKLIGFYYKHTTKFTIMEFIVCLTIVIYLLSFVIL